MFRLSLFALLLLVLSSTRSFIVDAFVVRPPTTSIHNRVLFRNPNSVQLNAREGDKEGGAAIAKPKIKTDIKTKEKVKEKQRVKKKAKIDEPKSRRKEEFQDAPLFKVMLLGDDSYDPGHVIERVCAIMEDIDEDAAATIYQQAQSAGKAMCGKYPMEHAEMYKEQLIRSDPMIFSDLEEENK